MKAVATTVMILQLLLAGHMAAGQQFMLVEKYNNLKNFKYCEGDPIRLQIKSEQRIIEGEITGLSDSSLFIGSWEEIMFNDIRFIYRERYWIRLSRGFFLVGGIGYFSVDAFNRLINNDSPVILMETLAISTGLVGLSFLLIPLKYKRINPEKWNISLIDFDGLHLYGITAP
jgi:hypothetical protein